MEKPTGFNFEVFESLNATNESLEQSSTNFNFTGFENFLDTSDSLDKETNLNNLTMKEDNVKNADAALLENLEQLQSTLKEATNSMVYHLYENFLDNFSKVMAVASLSDTLLKPCCGDYCCIKFTPESIMRARLIIPSTFKKNESSYAVVLEFHFLILKLCMNGSSLTSKIGDLPVCAEFFRRVYGIPVGRYNRLCSQIMLDFSRPLGHGNSGRLRDSETICKRIGGLVNVLAAVAEPMPDGKGYILPSSWTKTDLIRSVVPKNIKINTKQELDRLAASLHFHKSNAFTKCNICLTIRLGLQQNRFSPEFMLQAKHYLEEHLRDIKYEKHDYYVRMELSRSSNLLLSLAHDGMSKDKTKWPHVLEDRPKKLTDTMKIMNSLNLGVVHKTKQNELEENGVVKDQLHAYWNIDQMSGGTSDTIGSQLIHMISSCNPIPLEISIQLDNCPSNKNYNVLAIFGLLLLWVPGLKKIHLCMPQVGHTHDDVDRYFGILARGLKRQQVYSPFGYSRFIQKQLHSLVTNDLLPTTYHFLALTEPLVNKFNELHANHYFEISRDSDGNALVRIGKYLRSETFLRPKNNKESNTYIKLFKTAPDLTVFPEITPPNNLNMDNFEKLCKVMERFMSTEDFLELQSLPTFITENSKPESFQSVIQRINDRLVQTPSHGHTNSDERTVDQFLKDPKIWKTWAPPTASEITVFATEMEEVLVNDVLNSDETANPSPSESDTRARNSDDETFVQIPPPPKQRVRKTRTKNISTHVKNFSKPKRQHSTTSTVTVPKKRGRPPKAAS